MPLFVAPNLETELVGYIFQGYIAALGERGAEIAARFGLTDLDPMGWYPQQTLNDMFRALSDGSMNEMFDFVKIGMFMGELATEQQATSHRSIEEWFLGFNAMQAASFRYAKANLWCYSALVAPKHIVFIVPDHGTPCDLYYGVAYAAARRTRPADHLFSVVHREGSCTKNGDDHCVMDIRWWPAPDEDEEES